MTWLIYKKKNGNWEDPILGIFPNNPVFFLRASLIPIIIIISENMLATKSHQIILWLILKMVGFCHHHIHHNHHPHHHHQFFPMPRERLAGLIAGTFAPPFDAALCPFDWLFIRHHRHWWAWSRWIVRWANLWVGIYIIITRPRPGFGRLGLGGSSGVYCSYGFKNFSRCLALRLQRSALRDSDFSTHRSIDSYMHLELESIK